MQCGAFVTNDVAVVSVAFLTLVKKIKTDKTYPTIEIKISNVE